MLKKHWFYIVFAQTILKSIGFTVFLLKNVKKPSVLLCFPSKMLKNHWFYCAFVQKCKKSTGFYCVFGPTKYQKSIGFIDPATDIIEKPLVLQAKRPKDIEKPLVLL